MMNTAEYIIKKLEEIGITEIFGLAGDYNFNLLYAVQKNNSTNWIGCTNELNAGYAADGYARAKGYGAVITTFGVGELSAINAIAGAMAENIPVVHIVGTPPTSAIEKQTLLHHNLQNADYNAFINAYKNVTAATAFLNRDNAKMEIDSAFKILVKEKQPVYIAIPDDIAQMEISDRYVTSDWESDKETLQEVAIKISEKINNSKKPIIIGDSLIKRFDTEIEYREFVSKSQIPVTNFLMGANIINMDSENYIGGYFGTLKNSVAQNYVKDTDCPIAVGTIYSDLNSFGFGIPFNLNDNIAIYGNYTCINGKRYDNVKMSDVLESVTNQIKPKNININKPNIGYKNKPSEKEPLDANYIYPRLQEFLKENDIVITETGTVCQGVAPIKFPNNAQIEFQTLWGSIGWATPAAFGASLAKPQSRVVLITGEGAHQLTAMEVGSMLRYGTKPVIIVLNNNGYTIERLLAKEDAPFNDIVQMNYAKFARAFEGDIWATKVETAEDFDKALKVTQIMNKLCYLEVCTDSSDAPQLTKDLIKHLHSKNAQIVPPKSIHDKNEDNEYDFKSVETNSEYSNLKYETVVHKGFDYNIDNVEGATNE